MVRVRFKTELIVGLLLLCCCFPRIRPQAAPSAILDVSGQIMFDGRSTPYLIRHLPVNSFPQLPPAVEDALTRRGCLIPQSYEAHGPENVVHASLEQTGSSDWAVLCSANGSVSLLVFFSGNGGEPMVLATAPETERLQSHGSSNVLGFNWAIDPASPEDIHEAQLGMRRPSPRLDHDALADSVVDGNTTYHFYSKGSWTLIDTED